MHKKYSIECHVHRARDEFGNKREDGSLLHPNTLFYTTLDT